MPAGDAGGKNVKEMAGLKIGDLVVLQRVGSKKTLATWECLCPCGKKFIAVGSDLRTGKTKTCGCRFSIKSRRNWQGYEGLSKTYWRQLNLNAEQRGLEFTISIEEAWSLFQQQESICALSGLPISLSLADHTASLDRIDSHLGYIKNNIQWVHRDINRLKGSFPTERLIELCQMIAYKASLTNSS